MRDNSRGTAHLSTFGFSEHNVSVSIPGSISSRLSTRYVEVLREEASSSSADPASTKCVTSAMWTPTCGRESSGCEDSGSDLSRAKHTNQCIWKPFRP